MRLHQLKELLDQGEITPEQYGQLAPIYERKVVSVYYELRTLLYLGVLLFTSGLGILIYKNIGEFGHAIAIVSLFVLTGLCMVYAFRAAVPYTNIRAKVPSPYYDYVVLLGCLLFVAGLGYIQFQYEWFDRSLGEVTLLSALLFFYAAYRFDHLGALSLGVTAFASFWGIRLSPQAWYDPQFFEAGNLYNVAICFGAGVAAAAVVLDRRAIKTHFTFTYLHFSSLTLLTGALWGMFMHRSIYGWYLLMLYIGCAGAVYVAFWKKSFLFLLYAVVFGYIATTYWLADFVLRDAEGWFAYLMLSCGGFIYFVVRYRNYFKRAE